MVRISVIQNATTSTILGVTSSILASYFQVGLSFWTGVIVLPFSLILVYFIDQFFHKIDVKKNKAFIEDSRNNSHIIEYDGLSNFIKIGATNYDPNDIPFIKKNEKYQEFRKKYDEAYTDAEKNKICENIETVIKSMVTVGDKILTAQENNPDSKRISKIKDEFDEGKISKVFELINNLSKNDINNELKDLLTEEDIIDILDSESNYYMQKKTYTYQANKLCKQIADVYYKLGNVTQSHKDLYIAIDSLEHALYFYREFAKKDPDSYNMIVADILNKLGVLHREVRSFGKAEKELDESYAIYGKLTETNPTEYNICLAKVRKDRSYLYNITDKNSDAEREYIELEKILRQIPVEQFPICQKYLAQTLSALADFDIKTGNLQQAEIRFNEALKLGSNLIKYDPIVYRAEYASVKLNMINFNINTGKPGNHDAELSDVLNIYRQLYGEDSMTYADDYAYALRTVASLRIHTKNIEQAKHEYNKALSIMKDLSEKFPDAYSRLYATTLLKANRVYDNNPSAVNIVLQNLEKAEKAIRSVVDNEPVPNNIILANVLNMRAIFYIPNEKCEDADRYLNEARQINMELIEKYGRNRKKELGETLLFLSHSQLIQSQYETSLSYAKESLELFKSLLNNDCKKYANIIDNVKDLIQLSEMGCKNPALLTKELKLAAIQKDMLAITL